MVLCLPYAERQGASIRRYGSALCPEPIPRALFERHDVDLVEKTCVVAMPDGAYVDLEYVALTFGGSGFDHRGVLDPPEDLLDSGRDGPVGEFVDQGDELRDSVLPAVGASTRVGAVIVLHYVVGHASLHAVQVTPELAIVDADRKR